MLGKGGLCSVRLGLACSTPSAIPTRAFLQELHSSKPSTCKLLFSTPFTKIPNVPHTHLSSQKCTEIKDSTNTMVNYKTMKLHKNKCKVIIIYLEKNVAYAHITVRQERYH